MSTPHNTLIHAIAASLLISAVGPALASGDGDGSGGSSSGGHGLVVPPPPVTAAGMGQAQPQTPDISRDPRWRAYKFEQDGIEYLQVNDSDGNVRVTLGIIGGTVWTLPMGRDARRVSTSERRLVTPANAVRSVIHHTPDFELVAYVGTNGVVWAVEGSDGTP